MKREDNRFYINDNTIFDKDEKRFILKRSSATSLNYPLGERVYNTVLKTELYNFEIVDELNKLDFENKGLREENERLRQMIKGNVFERYREGSLADLEFKAIAYDDIIKVKLSDESGLKVIVYCKQGKKENVQSFCQMFIPFGVAYEIKEVINDE